MGTNLWIALWLLHALVADLIVIEPEGSDPALSRAIIDSYRGAVGDVDARADGSQARWYARVTWDDAKLHARIEIRRGSPDADVERVRDVVFSATDDLEQRHRAVGLIIAAHVLASAHAHADANAMPPPSSGATQPTAPPATPADDARADGAAKSPADDATSAGDDDDADAANAFEETHPLPALGVDLALLAGPALDRGAPRFGVMLRGFVRPTALPIAGVVGVSAARRFAAPQLMMWSASVGLLLRLQPYRSAFAVEARGEAVVQHTQAKAESADDDRSDSDGAWRTGGQLGLEAHATVSTPVSLFAGAQLRLLLPAVHLDVQGREVGVERALGWDALAGVRYAR